jgi:hypothetical protein
VALVAILAVPIAMPLMLGAVALHHGAHHLAVHFFAAFVFAPLMLLHMLGVLFRRMLRMIDGRSRSYLDRGHCRDSEKKRHCDYSVSWFQIIKIGKSSGDLGRRRHDLRLKTSDEIRGADVYPWLRAQIGNRWRRRKGRQCRACGTMHCGARMHIS